MRGASLVCGLTARTTSPTVRSLFGGQAALSYPAGSLMSRDQKQDQTRLQDREQMLEYFRSGFKTMDERGVGTEHEKFVFRKSDHQLISFEEIEALFGRLADRFGWEPALDRGRVIALERNDEAITLEPGGQLELSGGIKKTIFETRDELLRHFDELAEVGPEYDFTCWGMNPFDTIEDIDFIPKSRYDIMKKYLPTRGDRAHWMMKLTCTIQANLDFTSEEDATTMIRGAYLASPFISALFANSPLHDGEPTGRQGYRAHIWTRVDPDRSGIPDFMLNGNWTFEQYLDYVLDVPMFFIRREQGYIDMSGHSFRDFWHNGYGEHEAHMGDFELHLSTAFPEVRMKKYVEVRCADGGPTTHMLALPALWKGLIYNEKARKETCDLLCHYSAEEIREMFERASRDGIHATAVDDRPYVEVLNELVDVARRALDAIAERDGHASEAVFLSPLETILESQTSAADQLLADWKALEHDRAALIEAHQLF